MKARPPYSASGRGWIVTGAMSTPTIAVDTNSRPAGSSMKATGAAATSQAARQTAGRASRLPASRPRHAAERGEPAGVLAQGLGHPLQVARRALALELGREHAREHREQLLVALAEAARGARERGEAADARAVGQLERHAEVGDGGELVLEVEARVDGVCRRCRRSGAAPRPRPSGRRRSRAAGSPGWPAGRSSRPRACRRSGARCGRGRGARGTASRRAAAARAGRGRSASRPRTTGRRRSSRQRQS